MFTVNHQKHQKHQKHQENDIKIENELEHMYYMQDTLDSIKNLDIKNFNYIVFEEDLDNMYKTEFLRFFTDNIVPLLSNFHYLSIDTLDLEDEPYRVKLVFTKNIIRFIMNTLPYIYIKELLEDKDISGLHDALDVFDTNTQQKIINQISHAQKQYQSFSSMMEEIEDTITNEKKKNKFNEMLSLLDISMSNKSKLLDYYKSIIQNTGEDSLKPLVKLYLTNDLENVI